ncbi:MAG: DUF3726 domain-containing protein [Porticoccaceae bacterium]|nr:DUF3726 domain-containing protein [Porticoccaceae bacterium]
MKVSKNELTAALKKSFEGLGFGYGDYLDAANMVVWAQMHGLNGLEQLCRALPFLDGPVYGCRALEAEASELWIFNVEGASILLCASQIVDIACSVARRQSKICVRVDNCHNRMFVVERLANAAQRGLTTMACWSTRNTFKIAKFEAQTRFPKLTTFAINNHDASRAQSLFVMCAVQGFDLQTSLETVAPLGLTELGVGSELSSEFFDNAYSEALDLGIEMPVSLWGTLDTLTARVLVESTERSRAGAGE